MWRMRSMLRMLPVMLAVATLSACRQADGEVPTPDANRQAEIQDISRDILNVASGRDPQAAEDLAYDLRRYTQERPTAEGPVIELARRTSEALAGREVAPQAAEQLAQHYWLAITARELSDRQVEDLQADVQSLLETSGLSAEQATPISTQIGEVQKVATDRQRRWYEVF